ncbi:MAG: FHA domain-containing protein [Lentisphaeria bacterium]
MPNENPKVIVLSEQLRGKSFELTEEKYTVGRNEDCDIYIADPTISGHHCSFVKEEQGGYKLVDEGSTNGSRVNGVKVDSQKLANSDIVQAGAIEMLYDSKHKADAAAASTQTGINLESTAGTTSVMDVPNFSPFAAQKGSNDNSKLFVYGLTGFIIVLAAAVVIVLALLVLSLIS